MHKIVHRTHKAQAYRHEVVALALVEALRAVAEETKDGNLHYNHSNRGH